jgi:6-phosphofructokinase 1
MPIIKRLSDSPYRWKIGHEKLSKVANVERFMPKSFISRDGYGITARARRYLEPLIAGEDYPSYKKGMPQYVKLKNQLVEKKLPIEW